MEDSQDTSIPKKTFSEFAKSPFDWLIFLTWLGLIAFFVSYMFKKYPRTDMDKYSLIILFLIITLSLSQSFDTFSIVKIFEVSRKKKEAEKKAKELKAENVELKSQFISLMNLNNSNTQSNSSNFYFPDAQKIAGDKPNTSSPAHVVNVMSGPLPKPGSGATSQIPEDGSIKKVSIKKDKELLSRLTQVFIQKNGIFSPDVYVNSHFIPKDEMEQALKIYPEFNASVTSTYDGPATEKFGIKSVKIMLEFFMEKDYSKDRLHYLLKTIYDYNKKFSNKASATLYFVLVKEYLKEEFDPLQVRLNKRFKSAIEIGILRVVELD